MDASAAKKNYLRLLLMAVLSFASMYVFMYAMVDSFDSVYPSLNQAYMAGLMTAPMLIFELWLMGTMYPQHRLNGVLFALSALALVLLWSAIRAQTAITDREFLRSMIPHHSGAILMCEQASLRQADVRALCKSIVAGQAQEIRLMKDMLRRPEGGS